MKPIVALVILFVLSSLFVLIATVISIFSIPSCKNSCPEMHKILYHGITTSSHMFVEWDRNIHQLQILAFPISSDPFELGGKFITYLKTLEPADIISNYPLAPVATTYKFNILESQHNLNGIPGSNTFLKCDNLAIEIFDLTSNSNVQVNASIIIPNRYSLFNLIMFINDSDGKGMVSEVHLQQISFRTFLGLNYYPKIDGQDQGRRRVL